MIQSCFIDFVVCTDSIFHAVIRLRCIEPSPNTGGRGVIFTAHPYICKQLFNVFIDPCGKNDGQYRGKSGYNSRVIMAMNCTEYTEVNILKFLLEVRQFICARVV